MTEEKTQKKEETTPPPKEEGAEGVPEPVKVEEKKQKKEVLTVKEIDELYEDIKRASDGKNRSEEEKELVRRAIEAERSRTEREQALSAERAEKEALKQKVEEMENAIKKLGEQSNGRQSVVPNQTPPWEKTESGALKIPKKDFDDALKKYIKGA